jgi:competence protein ComGC
MYITALIIISILIVILFFGILFLTLHIMKKGYTEELDILKSHLNTLSVETMISDLDSLIDDKMFHANQDDLDDLRMEINAAYISDYIPLYEQINLLKTKLKKY